MKYVVIQNEKITQILDLEPAFVPADAVVISYDGLGSDLVYFGGVVSEKVAETISVPPVDLVTYKENLKNDLDVVAGQVRGRYITTVPGQAETYMEKAEQAIEYAAKNYPADDTPYPLVRAQANATGMTSQQAADSIIQTRSMWIGAASQIEEHRIRGKINIAATTTNGDAYAAFAVAKGLLESISL